MVNLHRGYCWWSLSGSVAGKPGQCLLLLSILRWSLGKNHLIITFIFFPSAVDLYIYLVLGHITRCPPKILAVSAFGQPPLQSWQGKMMKKLCIFKITQKEQNLISVTISVDICTAFMVLRGLIWLVVLILKAPPLGSASQERDDMKAFTWKFSYLETLINKVTPLFFAACLNYHSIIVLAQVTSWKLYWDWDSS